MEDMIKIDFTLYYNELPYSDALYLPADHTYTDAEIEAMKQMRFDAWVSMITTPQE